MRGLSRTSTLFALLATVWGTSFLAIEVGLADLPPVLFAALRFDVAAAVLFAYVVVAGYEWRPARWSDWALIAIGGTFLIGAHYALLFVGQSYVTSGIAAVMMSLTPVVTPAFAVWLLPKERLTLPTAVGILLGLVGVAIIARPDPAGLDGQLVGVALLFLSAVSFALGSVLALRIRSTMSLVSLQAWMMLVGAIALHLTSLVHPAESVAAATFSPTALLALAYLGVAATVGGFLCYFELLEEAGPVQVSLVNYVTPMIAVLVGVAALGEPLTEATLVGFGVILVGFLVIKWGAVRWRIRRLSDHRTERSVGDDVVVVAGQFYYR